MRCVGQSYDWCDGNANRRKFLKSLRFTLKWTDVRTGSEAVEQVEEEDETSDNDSDYSEASVEDSEDENDGVLRATISYASIHLLPSLILPLSCPRPPCYETAEYPNYVLPIPDSDTIVRGLRISKEDLDWANRFILLCYTDVDANGRRAIYDDPLNGLPIPIKRPAKGPMEKITQRNVWVHWDVVPGYDPADGVFDVIEKNSDKTITRRSVQYWVDSQTFLINYDAFLIIQGVFYPPKTLAPHVLFDLLWHFKRLPHYAVRICEAVDLAKEYRDYYSQPRQYISEVVRPWANPITLANLGPTAKAAGQDWDVLALAEPVKNEDDTKGKVKFFKPLLKDKTKTAEEKLKKLWLGSGNLWCLVAPNKQVFLPLWLLSPVLTDVPQIPGHRDDILATTGHLCIRLSQIRTSIFSFRILTDRCPAQHPALSCSKSYSRHLSNI